jgi:hypothetical protein
MSNTPIKNRFHEPMETEVVQYRAVEPMAVLCVIFGLLSCFAAFDLVGCSFAVPAIILGLLSLARLNKRPGIFAGRKAALLGLGLAILFAATGVARHFTSEYMIRNQAKTIGQEFLGLIANDRPELAFQWTLKPKERSHSASNVWAFYRSNTELTDKLREFVGKEGIRALLAIGSDAKIYPVGRASYQASSDVESVGQTYAIDFKSDNKAKTFFFGLLLRRFQSKEGKPEWMIVDYVGGFDPWKKTQ